MTTFTCFWYGFQDLLFADELLRVSIEKKMLQYSSGANKKELLYLFGLQTIRLNKLAQCCSQRLRNAEATT